MFQSMLRLGSLLTIMLMLTLATSVSPASADQPTEFVETRTVPSVDPCSGEEITVDLTFHVSVHNHQNNQVFIVSTDAVTSNGYAGTGHETFVETKSTVNNVVNFVLVSSETGQRFTREIRLHINFNTGQVRFLAELTCIGNPGA